MANAVNKKLIEGFKDLYQNLKGEIKIHNRSQTIDQIMNRIRLIAYNELDDDTQTLLSKSLHLVKEQIALVNRQKEKIKLLKKITQRKKTEEELVNNKAEAKQIESYSTLQQNPINLQYSQQSPDIEQFEEANLAPLSKQECGVIKKDVMKITTLFDANIKAQLNLVNTQSSQQFPDAEQFKEAKNKTTNQLSDLRKSLSFIEIKRFKEEGFFKHLTYMLTEMYQDLREKVIKKDSKPDIKSNMDIFQVINEIEGLVNEICCQGLDNVKHEVLYKLSILLQTVKEM